MTPRSDEPRRGTRDAQRDTDAHSNRDDRMNRDADANAHTTSARTADAQAAHRRAASPNASHAATGSLAEPNARAHAHAPQASPAASDAPTASVRTDLAMERGALFHGGQVPGVHMQEETHELGIRITRVRVDEQGAQHLEKEPGTYTTFSCEALLTRDPDAVTACAALLAEELRMFIGALHLPRHATALVIGLGNRAITPDALGPLSLSKLLVTRHLINAMPDSIDDRLRPVCAIAPSVLGVTGVETVEVIRGVVEHVKPDVILCIDALAARETKRICTSIQIASTGISPGSGIGNRRAAIDQATLGVPVLSLGVPMVVYASTISHDVITALLDEFKAAAGPSGELRDMLMQFGEDGLRQIVNDAARSSIGDLVVTPKEIDDVVQTLARTLALGLNLGLHDGLTEQEIHAYLA